MEEETRKNRGEEEEGRSEIWEKMVLKGGKERKDWREERKERPKEKTWWLVGGRSLL